MYNCIRSLILHQKLLWQDVDKRHKLCVQLSNQKLLPLELEISYCIKLMSTFLEHSDRNLRTSIVKENPQRVAVFSLLNSIVLENERFQKSYQAIHNAFRVLEEKKKTTDSLNDFETCVVGVVYSIQDLRTAVRELNIKGVASIVEAHANAVATQRLKNLCSSNYQKFKDPVGVPLFRDFDPRLCSNTETTVVDTEACEHPKRITLDMPKRIIDSQGYSYSSRTHDLSLCLIAFRDATKSMSEKTIRLAEGWHAVMDSSVFSFGVERYVEKCVQDNTNVAQIGAGLTRMLLLLEEVEREVRKHEKNPCSDNEEFEDHVKQLLECVSGYTIMSYWWWYQRIMGTDRIKKITFVKKLDTPTRTRLKVNIENNQDIMDEYKRDFECMRKMIVPKL